MIETSAGAEDVVMKHRTQLKKSNQWLTKNKLAINTEKTKSMFFGKSEIYSRKEQINIDKERIENVDSIRYLGITIDNKLFLKNHIEVVKQKLIKLSGIFYRLRKTQRIHVFRSYVPPVVQYGILIYGNSVVSDISLMDSKLKKLIRIILNKRTFNSVSELRRKFNLFLAKELHLYEVLKLLIKMLRDECVVSHFKSFLNDNELNRINKEEKKMCLDCGDRKNVTNRLRFKVRKMLNLLGFLEPSFVNTVLKMTNQQIKLFCQMFLRNYIIDNQDFSSCFF